MTMTAAGRYSQLATDRQQYLTRARDCARYTIPTLVPPEGHSPATRYHTPYQSLGAEGVNNLSSKLLLALLPVNTPFFRLQIDDFTLDLIDQSPGARGEFERGVSRYERAVMTHLETNRVRTSVHEALKYLIVTGNVLLYFSPSGGLRVFRLDRYTIHRDPMGNVLEIITRETISPDVLPDDLRKAAVGDESPKRAAPQRTIDLYTHVVRADDRWDVYQEAAGHVLPGSLGSYPLDRLPWIPLRWTKIDGENYGRGYVEEYLGDLRTLEGLTKAIVIGSSAAAKVLFFVNPNGTTKLSVVSKAESGDVVPGSAEDVSTLQIEKRGDFATAYETIQMVGNRLARAFLLNSAVQRDAERVTAEEVRYVAQELEDALGGVYSILSQEFQLPLVNALINDMESKKILPTLPKEIVKPIITTGLEALGRGHDLQKIMMMKNIIVELGPEIAMKYLNFGEYFKRTGASLGIDMEGLIKTEEEVQQLDQQMAIQQMIETLGPNAMKILQDQLKPEAQNNDSAT